jgi:hypothetical protein
MAGNSEAGLLTPKIYLGSVSKRRSEQAADKKLLCVADSLCTIIKHADA